MKTPKRTAETWLNPKDWAFDAPHHAGDKLARWKRKNRVRILKNTIAMLRRRLKDTEATLRLTQKITKCFFVKPDHWHRLDEKGNELTRKQWRVKIKKEEAAQRKADELAKRNS